LALKLAGLNNPALPGAEAEKQIIIRIYLQILFETLYCQFTA
jgi:hypothetical protein